MHRHQRKVILWITRSPLSMFHFILSLILTSHKSDSSVTVDPVIAITESVNRCVHNSRLVSLGGIHSCESRQTVGCHCLLLSVYLVFCILPSVLFSLSYPYLSPIALSQCQSVLRCSDYRQSTDYRQTD